MIFEDLIPAVDLDLIREFLASVVFSDGKDTAAWYGKSLKSNEQVLGEDPPTRRLLDLVRRRLLENSQFQSGFLPKGKPQVMFNRYCADMSYGLHVDGPAVGLMRKDISFTIFLSEPDEYEGGALALHLPYGVQRFKLAAGSAVAYPADSLHCVEPVAAGVRLAAVGWAQSQIRRFDQRQILVDIDTARHELLSKSGKTTEFDLLCRAYCNLIRLWAE